MEFLEELSEKVWSNERFQQGYDAISRAWLRHELSQEFAPAVTDLQVAPKMMAAAAILACSSKREHREAAFRVSTSIFELFGVEKWPFDQALRTTLIRLGNFPSVATRKEVDTSLERLPWTLAAEELSSADLRTVRVNGRDLTLTDFQFELWQQLSRNQRVACSAPTSAGKSYILEAYLISRLAKGVTTSVLYIVPTRALIAQVSDDLLGALSDQDDDTTKIITVPIDRAAPLPRRAVYVMTQERVQLMLNSHRDFSPETIVIDEAQTIADNDRGILLHSVIDELLERNETAQFLFASPITKNLDVFGRLFGLDIAEISSREATVAQNFLVVKTSAKSAHSAELSVCNVRDGVASDTLVHLNVEHDVLKRSDRLASVPFVLGRGRSNLVYANGQAEAENVALKISDLMPPDERSTEVEALASLAAECVHSKYALVDCVRKGVAFHYSNVPTVLRQAIERAFSSGLLTNLVCTSTLLQGVNLPAKNIFMYAPEKGNGNSLDSGDFWNLAGRAGRLRREFQGNIFLIDYDYWKRKPLDSAREREVVPAIEQHITDRSEALVSVIDDRSPPRPQDRIGSESAFVRLFCDFKAGTLERTLQRANTQAYQPQYQRVVLALKNAEQKISLPIEVIKLSSNISIHRQQKLYDTFCARLKKYGVRAAHRLIPLHPRESNAYASYSRALALCNRAVLDRDPARRLHRFHALMAHRWMMGWALPRIIEDQIRYKPNQPTRMTIRNTFEVIENQIRFQAVRLFTCYNALLAHALSQNQLEPLVRSIPTIPLYLEIGACDRTMISLIELGIPRVVAVKLNDMSPRKSLDVDGVLQWLKGRRIESFGLSPLLEREVRTALAGRI